MKNWFIAFCIICFGLLLIQFVRPTNSDEQKTLASFKKIDDFPLYEMHYYADYKFDDYLREGGGELSNPDTGLVFEKLSYRCTGFAALSPDGNMLFGRNFDWYVHPTMILFTNPPDAYASVSLVDISYMGYDAEFPKMQERRNLLRAPYLPFDGMNEKGLAVGMMAVDYANGGNDTSRMTLEDLDVIRLLLDYAATVDEGIVLLQNYNVRFEEVPLHYMLADNQGNSAVLEYLDGKMNVIRNDQNWQVSTNFLISEEKPRQATSSCRRYNIAYQTLERSEGLLTENEALDLLERVAQGGDFPTIWSVVYDMSNGLVGVVVDRKYNQVYRFQVGQ